MIRIGDRAIRDRLAALVNENFETKTVLRDRIDIDTTATAIVKREQMMRRQLLTVRLDVLLRERPRARPSSLSATISEYGFQFAEYNIRHRDVS